MFDVGFSELIVIALVALIVIGPERLPRVARTLGALLGRAQRYVNDVKADIQREVDMDELKSVQSTFQDAAKSVEQSVNQAGEELQSAGEAMNQSVAGIAESREAPQEDPPAPAAADAAIVSDQLDLGLEPAPADATAAAPKT